MPAEWDLSGCIALWLFRIGVLWAVILVPLTILSFFSVFGRGAGFWQLGIYLLFGYGVWLGWRWRSRQRRKLGRAALLWLFSAAFNLIFIVHLIATEPEWQKILIFDGTAFYAWWWIAVTLASIVALMLEFLSRQGEDAPT